MHPRPDVPIAFYGLYAGVGADRTVGNLTDRAIAGEYMEELVQWFADPTGSGLSTLE